MARRAETEFAEKWFIVILLAFLVVGGIGTEVKSRAKRGLGFGEKSKIWSLGSSSKKTTSAPVRTTQAHVRTTQAHVRTTQAHVRTTQAHVRTTHGPIWATKATVRTTTHGPIYPHPRPIHKTGTTTPRPYYPTQPYYPPPPTYPLFPNPPPIYVPPPPQPNPTIIFVERATPKPPRPSIIIGSFSSKTTTKKPTTTTTTTTRRPKTTTEEPWQGIEGGYDRKAWIDFVKSTQRKDIPLSGQWVRIRGGKSMREGYVEIVGEGGVWGSVCDVTGRWDLHKANIVCHQLGYRGGAEAAWQGRPVDNTIVQLSQVREVNCGPTASTLLHCNLRRSKEGFPSEIDVDGTCFGRTRNVGVRCRSEPNTVCKFGEKAFGKSCYRLVAPPSYGRSKDFATLGTEAVTTCRSLPRSHIVSVTTQTENDFLSDWLQSEYPSVDTVLTSGIGTFLYQNGPKKPPVEWWLWSGQYKDVEYERWWPGWTSKSTITPIVPAKSMMCIVMHNRFPHDNKRGPSKAADYFFWKAYTGTSKSVPIPFVCERPTDDVGCLALHQEYTGPANISESGKACLRWNLQEVRNSPIMSNLYLSVPSQVNEMVNSGGNACRRVTMDKEPWCFVSPGPGQQPIPEQCLIPVCGQPSAITSYYEAPKKTNDYAPYNQIPAIVGLASIPRTETIATNLPGFSYSVPLLSQARTLVIKEEPDSVASAKQETSFKTRMIDEITGPLVLKNLEMDETFEFDPNATLPEIEHHRSLMEVATVPSPPVLPVSNSEIPLDARPDNTSALSIQAVSLSNTRRLVFDAISSSEEVTPKKDGQDSLTVSSKDLKSVVTSSTFAPIVVQLPSAECELRPNDSNTLSQNDTIKSTELPCIPKVTYPPVPTPPALYYPHPENEIIMATTVRSTDAPKRSLYGSHDSARGRYAAGKGRAFHRQLSSSDLVLILNGILPMEQVGSEDVPSTVSPTDTETTPYSTDNAENVPTGTEATPYSTGNAENVPTDTESTPYSIGNTENVPTDTETTPYSTGNTENVPAQTTSLYNETEPIAKTENPSTTLQPKATENSNTTTQLPDATENSNTTQLPELVESTMPQSQTVTDGTLAVTSSSQ